jgi:hypothetical protein
MKSGMAMRIKLSRAPKGMRLTSPIPLPKTIKPNTPISAIAMPICTPRKISINNNEKEPIKIKRGSCIKKPFSY